MKICYLLESADLWGGVRVVFDQARALQQRGHRVRVRARAGDHRWYPYPVDVTYVSDLAEGFIGWEPDVVVATFWTTVRAACAAPGPQPFHLCQCYESDIEEYGPLRDEIDAAYRLPIPKITIGNWLSERLIERFGRGAFDVHTAGQIVDTEMYMPPTALGRWCADWVRRRHEVLVVGLFDASVKGIPDALEAVALVRKRRRPFRLVRVSTVDTRRSESAVTPVDEFHVCIAPHRLARLYRRASALLAPSHAAEGFGLPFAEALSAGVPCVATSIPSHTSFDRRLDYACFVPERNPGAMADALERVLSEKQLRQRLRARGPEVVRSSFTGARVAERLDSIFRSALP